MSTIAVNQITDSSGLFAPVFPPGSAQLNPMAGREDGIINGNFNIWQRATSHSTSQYGSADRWLNEIAGGTVTMSRQSFTVGDTLGVNTPAFHLRQTVSGQTLPSHYSIVSQRIESVRSYAGKTITVLGWARRPSGSTGNMVVEGYQYFGTSAIDTPSTAIPVPGSTTVVLSTEWAPFAAVINVPSITGKTLGTNLNDWLGIFFWTSAGTDWNARTNGLGLQNIAVDLWGIHIRQGTWTAAATADYRPRDPGTELALCQRYFQRWDFSAALGSAGATAFVATKFSGTDAMIANIPLICGMRAPPTVTSTLTTARAVLNTATGTTVTLSAIYSDANGPIVLRYVNNAVTAGFGWVDSIGIISASAEI